MMFSEERAPPMVASLPSSESHASSCVLRTAVKGWRKAAEASKDQNQRHEMMSILARINYVSFGIAMTLG